MCDEVDSVADRHVVPNCDQVWLASEGVRATADEVDLLAYLHEAGTPLLFPFGAPEAIPWLCCPLVLGGAHRDERHDIRPLQNAGAIAPRQLSHG